jgi:cation diffusion facilitator family transporter
MTDVPPTRSSDDRALLLSTWTSAGFAVVAVAWGLLTGSRLIIFDGLYSFASVGLSLMAVAALRTARRGPDERYPWGREVWEPLTVVVKAAALAGLSVYALVGGVGDVLAGGRDVEVGLAVVYGVVATVAGVVVTVVLRRRARAGSSDLVRAEAAEWTGDTLLSVGVLAGFVLAAVLLRAGRADLARYVDPVMVVVVSAAFLPIPARLMITGFREVLTMAAPADVQEPIVALVGTLAAEYGLADSVVRTSKVGGRLDLDVVFLVGDGTTVHRCDAVRAELERRLAAAGHHVSMSVGFTADRRWAQ